ncbi:MAG TPA: sugar phosphate isomerase/epimerase [Bryobacteraceae bacterium]|nr:sugar phosphate isomerase/epimerase [Bryobacteraceae bacterium]
MTEPVTLSRRTLLALAAAAPFAKVSAANKQLPVGLELYSVRDELHKDLPGTVRAVAKMGYQCVEFFSPYMAWSTQQAKDIRALLDELGIRCSSTHNGPNSFSGAGLEKATELNQILGSKYIVMASAGRVTTLDDWKKVADTLSTAAEKLKPTGIKTGYHNHQAEFTAVDGKRPMEVLAANTGKDVMLQLDVGHCIETGADPVAWINQNPGRIQSLHLKDWSRDPAVGFKALLGEGVVPWKQVFEAAEKTGGAEFYLVEQEGSRFSAPETAEKCLAEYKKLHG